MDMDFSGYFRFEDENEKPLDRLVPNGGYCGIIRTLGCIGDSLASGEFESRDENGNVGYHDIYAYSWGQFMARDCGLRAYNFSCGGLTAREYMRGYADDNGFWSYDKVCQAYIIALGVNDIINDKDPVGTVDDIDLENWRNNKKTFAGNYGAIIQRLLEKQPKARFFFVTMPKNENGSRCPEHTELLYEMTKVFPFSYVIDMDRYSPPHDKEFKKRFYLGGHLNAAGYLLIARQFESYIDYIIRHNPDDFLQIGFVGTPWHNERAKW